MLRLRGPELAPHPATLPSMLDDAARRAPDRAFLVERDAQHRWRQITFATAAKRARRIAAALRSLGASETAPLMILSANGIDHALMALGAACAGVPVAPLDPRIGRDARDGFARLRATAAVVRPAVVFARDGAAYGAGVRAAVPQAAFVCAGDAPAGGRTYDYAQLLAHTPQPEGAVHVDADTIAKLMFGTERSDEPAAVVVTHGMIGAMLQGLTQAWPFLAQRPPEITGALPWSGAFGGNAVFGIALRHAGTLHLDDSPALAPTLAFDLPAGWAHRADLLRTDDALRRRWLANLDLACWSGATMPPATRDALHAIGVPLGAVWSSTETAGALCATSGTNPVFDALGAPLAGVEIALHRADGEYEARVRGAQVTAGYYWRPGLTAAAFDDDGDLRTGDLVRPLDARAPQRGLAYAGRLDRSFRLSSGAWVHADELREAFLAECRDARDVLVTGQGGSEIGLLVSPTPDAALLDRAVLRAQVADAMRRVVQRGAGTPHRALILDPLARASNRAGLVTRLHASEPDDEVIVL